jgi:hypothetical protein
MEFRKETVPHCLVRKSKNAWHCCRGTAIKTDELIRIQNKKHLLEQRKKQFGVQYMDLVQSNASEEDLDSCLRYTKADIARLEQEIILLQIAIERTEEKIRSKIRKNPRKATAVDHELESLHQTTNPDMSFSSFPTNDSNTDTNKNFTPEPVSIVYDPELVFVVQPTTPYEDELNNTM